MIFGGFTLMVSVAIAPSYAVIDKLFSAFNSHDAQALQQLYDPKARLTSSDFCKPRNGYDVVRTYKAIFMAFPDIRDDIDTVVIDKDRAAVRFMSSGGQGSSAFRFEFMTFFRFSGGRIVEDHTVFDTHGRPCEP